MNWVDLVILLAVFLFAIEGLKRGFVLQTIDIIGLLISLLVSLALYPFAANVLIGLFNLPQITANPVGFLLIWIVSETLFFYSLFKNFPKAHISPSS